MWAQVEALWDSVTGRATAEVDTEAHLNTESPVESETPSPAEHRRGSSTDSARALVEELLPDELLAHCMALTPTDASASHDDLGVPRVPWRTLRAVNRRWRHVADNARTSLTLSSYAPEDWARGQVERSAPHLRALSLKSCAGATWAQGAFLSALLPRLAVLTTLNLSGVSDLGAGAEDGSGGPLGVLQALLTAPLLEHVCLDGCWRLLRPTPALPPRTVVQTQVQSLAQYGDGAEAASIGGCWAFASPGNREATGPRDRFQGMFVHHFGRLLRCSGFTIRSSIGNRHLFGVDRASGAPERYFIVEVYSGPRGGGDAGRTAPRAPAPPPLGSLAPSDRSMSSLPPVFATSTPPTQPQTWFLWVVNQQDQAPYEQCWMTSGVVELPYHAVRNFLTDMGGCPLPRGEQSVADVWLTRADVNALIARHEAESGRGSHEKQV